LPLVTGGGEGGGGVTPFIEIPTARNDVGEGEQESTTGNTTAANPTATRQTPVNPVAGQ
jgi:hypothetical protein